jgi:hypothetical protein
MGVTVLARDWIFPPQREQRTKNLRLQLERERVLLEGERLLLEGERLLLGRERVLRRRFGGLQARRKQKGLPMPGLSPTESGRWLCRD